LVITIELPKEEAFVQLRGIWLRSGDKTYSYKDFEYSSAWDIEADRYFLMPGSSGELTWRGKIGERTALTIFPMDSEAHVTVLWDGETFEHTLTDETFKVDKKSTAPFWYYVLLTLTRIICLGTAFYYFFDLFQVIGDSRKRQAGTVALLILLSLFSVYLQFENPEIKGRLDIQISRHNAVIAGVSLNPWQYRVLAEWLIEALVRVAGIFGSTDPYFGVFAVLRTAQNLSIFALFYAYLRRSGFSGNVSLMGIMFLTGSMLNSFHQSDLSFNTYFDVIFYLCSALLILNNLFVWLPFVTIFASLNRETSGLIPLLGLSALTNFRGDRVKSVSVAFSLFLWGVIFILLRILYPGRELFIPYGYHPGFELLTYNLTLPSLHMLLRFFSFAPFVGLIYYRHSPPFLRRVFIAIVPIWFLVHFPGSVVSEARLFLVPQLLVFIPMFLAFVRDRYPVDSQ
jgi:hypothetical protein